MVKDNFTWDNIPVKGFLDFCGHLVTR